MAVLNFLYMCSGLW